MNAIIKIDEDDFAPARLTGADVLAMTSAGVLPEGRGYELIEGVLVKMAAQYDPHVRMISQLLRKLNATVPEELLIASAPSIFFSDQTMLEPDIAIFPLDMKSTDVRGDDILLAIEVSDTTLRYDLGKKAKLYAAHGVEHYWVFDVTAERLHRHSGPRESGYASIITGGFNDPVPLPIEGLAGAHLQVSAS